LGKRMSAEEFGEWKAFYAAEDLYPAAQRLRHAQLVAAIHNGELRRQDKRLWSASDFMLTDPWAPPPVVPEVSVADQVNAINSLLD
jgi:hypothetical protein